MSRVAELAREEAERAEAEDDTENEDEPTETPDENEEGEAAEEAEVEADESAATQPEPFANVGEAELKRANRAVEDQRVRLAKILGEAAVAHECLMCGSLGYLPELPPVGTRMTLAADEEGYGLMFEPPEDQRTYPKARDKAPCDWCDAEGMVETGSKNPHARVMPCTKCSGNGWVIVPVMESPQPVQAVAAATPPAAPAVDGLAGTVDTWGRPWGHEHFGVPPAQIRG